MQLINIRVRDACLATMNAGHKGCFAWNIRRAWAWRHSLACAVRRYIYAGQFIGYGEKPVKVSGRLFIQVFINLKCAALYTVPAALAEESLPLLFRQFGDTFLKAFEPISKFHKIDILGNQTIIFLLIYKQGNRL